jgi:hypothetical protein
VDDTIWQRETEKYYTETLTEQASVEDVCGADSSTHNQVNRRPRKQQKEKLSLHFASKNKKNSTIRQSKDPMSNRRQARLQVSFHQSPKMSPYLFSGFIFYCFVLAM